MKKFRFSFTGRQVRAIGIFYLINDTYKANSLGEALYMLYTDYEHISSLTCNGEKVGKIELIECEVPKREKNHKTGSYLYTRNDTVNN